MTFSRSFCDALSAVYIYNLKTFKTNDLRLKNADKLKKMLEEILREKNTNFWIKK